MRGHRHCSWSRNVDDDRCNRGDEHGRRGGQRRRRGDGARGRDRAPQLERFVRNHASRASRQAACSGCSCSSRWPPSCSTTSARATSHRRRSRSRSPSSLTVALWVGANLLFDQAYDHWTRFNTIIGARARLRRLLRRRVERLAQDARRQPGAARRLRACSTTITGWSTRPFDVNSLLWGLIGGAALGLVMFLLSAPRQQLARLPLAVVGFTGFGLLTAFALDDSV